MEKSIPSLKPKKRPIRWRLKKEKVCLNCKTVFPKGSSVGKFLRHVQKCGR